MISSKRLGATLILFAVLLISSSLLLSWATAPSIAVGDERLANETNVVGLHGAGEVVVTDGNGNEKWRYGNATGYYDVEQTPDGNILAAFIKDSTECGQFESPCARTGYRIISHDPNPHVVKEWTYPVRNEFNSEVHDADLLPSGNVVVADMEYERILVVSPEGQIEWEWNASERYDPPSDPTQEDWLHINDVDYIGDDRFLVSVRNEHQLLILERGEGVVEVVNEDGNQRFLQAQHNPQWLGDGAILVGDSDNNRVVELHKENGEWKIAWTLHGAGGVPFDWPRDADRLPNGHTLITDSHNDRVVEVTRTGEVVASYEMPGLPYETDRLPGGESNPGPAYENTDVIPNTQTGEVPVLTKLLTISRFVVPWPYWVTEIHVLAVLLGVGLTAVGTERILSHRISKVVTVLDRVASPLYSLSDSVSAVLAPFTLVTGLGFLVAGAVPGPHRGLKLAIGGLLLCVGWQQVMASERKYPLIGRISARTRIFGKLLIVPFTLLLAGVIFATGFLFPGSAVIDVGLSIVILLQSLRLFASKPPSQSDEEFALS